MLWWDPTQGKLFVWYSDPNTAQWVEAVATPDLGPDDFVSVDVAQSFTEAEKKTARSNIYAAPFDAMAYSGMQYNGSMEVSQERGVASVGGASAYICDGWRHSSAGTMALASSAPSVAGTGLYPGFNNVLAIQTTTAQASLGAGDFAVVLQSIEGYRVSRLAWGTASAQPITIAFWSSHKRTGLFSGSLRNDALNRSYAFTYTHAVTDVAQYNVITIPGDTAGVWGTGNGVGIMLTFSLGSGSTYTAPSANTWVAGGFQAAPGQINAVSGALDFFRITGVVVLPGIEAPSAARSSLIMRPFDQELLTCQRYYRQLAGSGDVVGWAQAYATTGAQAVCFFNEMRATPTLSMSGNFTLTAANSSSLTVTGYVGVAACPTSVAANITVGSGLVAGNVTKLSLADGNARFKIDARL
jgi:hypothetical protein